MLVYEINVLPEFLLAQRLSGVLLLYTLPWSQGRTAEAENQNSVSSDEPQNLRTIQSLQKLSSIITSLKSGNWKFLASSNPLHTS